MTNKFPQSRADGTSHLLHRSLHLHNHIARLCTTRFQSQLLLSLRVRSATTVICGTGQLCPLIPRGCLKRHVVSRLRQLILIWTPPPPINKEPYCAPLSLVNVSTLAHASTGLHKHNWRTLTPPLIPPLPLKPQLKQWFVSVERVGPLRVYCRGTSAQSGYGPRSASGCAPRIHSVARNGPFI